MEATILASYEFLLQGCPKR